MQYMYVISVFLLSLLFIESKAELEKEPKIVAMMQVRNEQNFLRQCLLALQYYVDAIVILDDDSTDDTFNIITSLKEECRIATVLRNTEWKDWNEPSNKNKLLAAARAIGGTHMIVIDADEMFSANCRTNNCLRNTILSLKPGDYLGLQWINLWRGVTVYRDDDSVWVPRDNPRIFCDNGTAYYPDGFLHLSPIPHGLDGVYYAVRDVRYSLLHFQFVNWRNLLIKQAWYRCLEHIHNPTKSIEYINTTYGRSKNEDNIRFKAAHTEWFEYPFFDASLFEQPEQWRKKQVLEWFTQYGKEFFAPLDIWDIDWDAP